MIVKKPKNHQIKHHHQKPMGMGQIAIAEVINITPRLQKKDLR